MKKSTHLGSLMLILAATAGISSTALAAEKSNIAYLAANCANCHGTDGKSVTPIMPKLAGHDREFILETMRAYRSGERTGTIMPQLSKGYTDEEYIQLADYFSKVK